jgi:hypothetical protein
MILLKKLLLWNQNKRKQDQILQNLLSKAMARIGPFSHDDTPIKNPLEYAWFSLFFSVLLSKYQDITSIGLLVLSFGFFSMSHLLPSYIRHFTVRVTDGVLE